MMCSAWTLSIGNNQYGMNYDSYLPPAILRLVEGPSCNIFNNGVCSVALGQGGGVVVDTFITPKPVCSHGLSARRATPFGREDVSSRTMSLRTTRFSTK
jgi:hypothetical protein